MSVLTPVIERNLKTTVFEIKKNRLSADALRVCTDVVQAGGVVVFPTDTVYGIGCNAFRSDGIEKIYRLKGRSYTKPLPVLLARSSQLSLVATDMPKEAQTLIEAYWPGPLTLVFKTAPLALHASRGKNTIAVRVPQSTLVHDFLMSVDVPLATTSANKSGKPALTSGTEVRKAFMGKVDVIIDGGACDIGEASSVVDATHVPFTILREGALSKAELTQKLKLG